MEDVVHQYRDALVSLIGLPQEPVVGSLPACLLVDKPPGPNRRDAQPSQTITLHLSDQSLTFSNLLTRYTPEFGTPSDENRGITMVFRSLYLRVILWRGIVVAVMPTKRRGAAPVNCPRFPAPRARWA